MMMMMMMMIVNYGKEENEENNVEKEQVGTEHKGIKRNSRRGFLTDRMDNSVPFVAFGCDVETSRKHDEQGRESRKKQHCEFVLDLM